VAVTRFSPARPILKCLLEFECNEEKLCYEAPFIVVVTDLKSQVGEIADDLAATGVITVLLISTANCEPGRWPPA
jgi:hypothetical protein